MRNRIRTWMTLAALVASLSAGCEGEQAVVGEDATYELVGTGGVSSWTHTTVPAAPLGAPCAASDELAADFAGFSEAEVVVETEAAGCASNLCLVNHLLGRASCPYGQTPAEVADGTGTCQLPWSNGLVAVPVQPALAQRQPSETSTCSCRCAGPGAGPFCDCGAGLECVHLVDALGLGGDELYAGSYCIPSGADYQNSATDPIFCDRAIANCGDERPFRP